MDLKMELDELGAYVDQIEGLTLDVVEASDNSQRQNRYLDTIVSVCQATRAKIGEIEARTRETVAFPVQAAT